MSKEISQFQAVLLACIGSALVGSSGIFVRLSDLGPISTGFYRMLFALPLLAAWTAFEYKGALVPSFFPRKHLLGLFLSGLFFTFDLALWNWSLDYTTIVNSTLLNNTAAFFVPLIMWIWVGQKPSARSIITGSIGFLGCMLLAGESFSVDYSHVLGDLVSFISGFALALYLISLKSIRETVATGFIMFWTGLVALFFLAYLTYLFGESFFPLTLKDIVSIFGQAILIHVLGQSLLAYSLGKIPANYTAIILFLAPMTGAILGWLMYDEALNMMKVIGMFLIMVSIIAMRERS